MSHEADEPQGNDAIMNANARRLTGIEAFVNVLTAAGIDRIFGNPGTTELPLNDALAADHRLKYVLGIHEIPVVAMADGFAMASGQVAVVNVHIACGLGNAMGMLYNAHIEGTPLLLTAGQQDRRLALGEPVLWGQLTEVARPWTKWSYEVQRAEDVAAATRRALQIALTPPTGPVFLSLPVDVQTDAIESDDVPWAPAALSTRVRPDRRAVRRIVDCLQEARNPVILAGSRVAESGERQSFGEAPRAAELLVQLAEHLGCRVITEATSSHGRLPIDSAHPCYGGRLPLWSNEIRKLLEPHDTILAIGLDLFRTYIHDEPRDQPFAPDKTWLQIDGNAYQLGKNFPVDVGVLGDIEFALADLLAALPADAAADKGGRRKSPSHTIAAPDSDAELTPATLMSVVALALPDDAAVVEEAVTTHGNYLETHGVLRNPRRLFAHRGWALGWGIGCAIGVQLAWPDVKVLGLIGDGAAMYGIQGLWTAAKYRAPVVFLICNNRQYKILKDCSGRMPLDNFADHGYLGMDLDQPLIDFVALSESLGVRATRVQTAGQLRQALQDAFDDDRPCLIDAAVVESDS